MTISPDLPQVLVIDDEIGPRESLRMLLKPNYQVHTAESVEAGIKILKEKHPDAVISDIRMPGTNGIDGLRKIREIDPHVSVIMLTGFGALEEAEEALRLGLVQEVHPHDELLAAADTWCDRIAALPPHAFEMTKPLLRAAADMTWEQAIAMEEFAEPQCFTTPSLREAVGALVEGANG